MELLHTILKKGLLVLVAVALSTPLMWSQKLYFVDNDAKVIQRCNFDGTGLETLTANGEGKQAHALTVDPVGGKVYWWTTPESRLYRANLDGSGKEELFYAEFNFFAGMAIHLPSGKLYYHEHGGGIYRANLDGSGSEFVTSAASASKIAIDPVADKIYWTESGQDPFTGRVLRADLDGSNLEVLATGKLYPSGVALDLLAGKLYWGNVTTIERANLDGTGATTIANQGASGLDVDPVEGKLFIGHQRMYVADLDGNNIQQLTGSTVNFFGGPTNTCMPFSVSGPLFTVSPPLASVGDTVTLQLCGGVPGVPVALFTAPPLPVVLVMISGLDAIGRWQVQGAVPSGLPMGFPIGMQCFTFDPHGSIILSNPASLTVQ